MSYKQQEDREELLDLAVDLLGDVMLLDCLLERVEGTGWEGDILDALTDRLHSYIQTHCRDITAVATFLTARTHS